MNKTKIFLLLIFVILIFTSCGKKKHEIISDNITAVLPIESVAVDNNADITEGNARFIEGDFDTAIEYYKQATQQNKAVAFYNIGVCYYLLNNIPQAELNFREAVTADPNFDEAIINLVAVLAQQERIVEAEKYLTKIVYTTKSPQVYVNMANLTLRLGDTAKAAYYYKKALDNDPKSPYVQSNYANFLISVGGYQDGIDILDNITDKDFSMYYNMAYAYYKLGDESVAYSYANDALYSVGATEEGYNKLANLFYDLKRYAEEAKTLNILIRIDPKRDYKLRLITSYINIANYDKALDELRVLLAEYPNDVTLNMLNYEVLILAGKTDEAGKFVRQVYKRLGGDTVLYYYTKHVSLYERNNEETRGMIFVTRDNGWLNLARTVYYLHKGDFPAATNYLNKVPNAVGHDYYLYKTFLAIIAGKFREAEIYLANMDKMNPDTFWYGVVIAWNLNQPNTILKLANDFRGLPTINLRPHVLKFNLIPVLSDMNYTYSFDGRSVDDAAMLGFPLFLEPNEIAQFIIMGNRTLKDSEKADATRKLEGMKRNNEGIDSYFVYDFDTALKKFRQSSDMLSNNSLVSYNIGMTYFNLGDNENAYDYFSQSINQDKANPFAYFGMGLVNYRRGNVELMDSNLDQARKLAQERIETSEKKNLNDIRLFYLATLASERFNKRTEANSVVTSNDALVSAIDTFMKFSETNDYVVLNDINNSPVFRVNAVKDLLLMRNEPAGTFTETPSNDIYYTLAKKYIMLARGGKSVTALDNKLANNKVYLKDMAYAAIFERNKTAGLDYLKLLTKLDYRYPELYKVSLYYFTWVRDFVNAEASYSTLDRLGYSDRTTAYYMLLYFLINYNETRLNTYLGLYLENYKEDYRTLTINALMNLNMKDVNNFYTIMSKLLASDPYIFNKMFIEVNFEKF